jgi:hypothetical protein
MGEKNKLKCCVVRHTFQCQADRKRAAEEFIRNVASKRARTLCSGHICPSTTHFVASFKLNISNSCITIVFPSESKRP